MQASVKGSVEQQPLTQPLYQLLYVGGSKIEKTGYKFVENICKYVNCYHKYKK